MIDYYPNEAHIRLFSRHAVLWLTMMLSLGMLYFPIYSIKQSMCEKKILSRLEWYSFQQVQNKLIVFNIKPFKDIWRHLKLLTWNIFCSHLEWNERSLLVFRAVLIDLFFENVPNRYAEQVTKISKHFNSHGLSLNC